MNVAFPHGLTNGEHCQVAISFYCRMTILSREREQVALRVHEYVTDGTPRLECELIRATGAEPIVCDLRAHSFQLTR